jgi:hypothetical protein
MTKSAVMPLDSFRLAEYAMPVPCYVCEADNTSDAEFCTRCYAPMALAHQAKSQGLHPRMLAAVGAADSGKTVYLGMLMDMLSRQSGGLQLLGRGAFSITLQQTTIYSLARGEFPSKTPNEPDRWNWVHCQLRRSGREELLELIMPDMAGEAVLEEVDHPHSYRVVRSFLQRAGAAMVFLDAAKLREGRLEQDHFAMKLLSYLSELETDTKGGWWCRALALVLTKADQCEECLEDPAGFARAHSPGLWQQCQERFARHRFFAASVAGATTYRDLGHYGREIVPLRIEPRGVIEPFLWVAEAVESPV